MTGKGRAIPRQAARRDRPPSAIPARPARPPARWRSWAASLAGRFRLRAVWPGGVERVLARPRVFRAAGTRLVHERWLLASRTLAPQIHLAIQPVLRPRLWQSFTLAAPRGTTALSSPAGRAEAIRTNHPATPGEELGPVRTVLGRLPAPAATGDAPPSAVRVHRAAAPPLQLVLGRLRAPASALDGRPMASMPTRPALARSAAGRVRREQGPLPSPPARVLAKKEEEPAGRERRAPDVAASSAPPSAARAPWPGAPAFPMGPQPAVDTGAIADRVMQQIDRRLVAWRERTGF